MTAHRGGSANRIESIEVGAHVRGRESHDEGDRRCRGDNSDEGGDVGQDLRTHGWRDDLGGCARNLTRDGRLERGRIHRTHGLIHREELSERHRLEAQGCCGARGEHHDVDARQR